MTTSYELEILSKTADVPEPIDDLPSKNGELVKYTEAGDFEGARREVVAKFKSPEAIRDFGKAINMEVRNFFSIKLSPE
jgi:hypothetical protein